MSLIRNKPICAAKGLGVCLAWMAMAVVALAQTISTTTVQGTVYLANGSPGSGTLQLSWPAFTTASSQAVAAGKITANIGADGFVSVNLAPNLGSSPAGLYYTAIYHMSDGTTSTEYWVVPAAAQASIAQVRSQVMPAAQAVQAVSKAYVDQAIQSLAQGNLTSTGGQLTGPLYLTGDPTQALQAADKHYVDSSFAQAVPLSGAAVSGPLTAQQLGAAYQVDQFSGVDFGAKLQACLAKISGTYGGTCDARNFNGNLAMAANLAISTANTTVMLPCATISTASQIMVTAGTRNVSLRGCALRGASNASGSQGGTVLLYSGSGAAIQVGDRSYAADTLGFHLDDLVINTTASSSSNAQAISAYRTQEMDLESLYLLGNANQTGMTLDGTGNYTGGTFYDNHISGFQTAINGIGHQTTNSAATDWLNASTFVRLHIDCPTANGNPIAGTYGVNLQQGDGNNFTGGDVENCGTAVHLGMNAQNNTIVGLRNENSTYQVVADAGSSYNSWMTGGTMFTGKLTDNGTRNSFLDTFHRSFNSLNGDWYGSQQDATLTNHYRLGIGSGNERGLLDRYQTDNGYRWTTGLSDATGGEQFYQVLDELNSVYRLSIGQYNNSQASTNAQTVINAAGTGAVVLNGSNNAGTGGVVFGSGGANAGTVATVSSAGNAQFNGTLQVGGTAQSAGTMTVRNNADAEVDYYLWPGLTSSQKGSFTYKDWNGNSQWYMVKDASNNWALNSATGGLDSFKAYQSANSGDTYINASNSSGVVRVNYETGAGSAFNIYGGNSGNLYASFSGNTSIKFPGLAASSGHNCLQIDSLGYITNTGAICGSGSGSGTVNSGSTGQIAYYSGNGTAISGMSAIPVPAGGTGASTAAGALAALGGVSLAATTAQNLAGPLNASVNSQLNVMTYGAKGDCVTDDHNAIMAAQTAAQAYATGYSAPAALYFPKPPGGCYLTSSITWTGVPLIGQPAGTGISSPSTYGVVIKGKPGQDVLHTPDPSSTSFTWNRTWTIRDITIMVDATAPGSFPHRWPGRWFDDAGMTSGSAVLTTANGDIGCSDVGQAIQVNGAGASGANLVTTIASVDPCWANAGSATSWKVITLAAAASTTVTNAHSYVSLLGLPVTATIGACGIAMDDMDANPAGWVNPGQTIGSIYPKMENVAFEAFDGPANNTCGIYTQGEWGLYGLTVQNFAVPYQSYGIVQGSSELNSSYASNAGDFESWKHGLFFMDVYPWISYNGGEMRWEDIEMTVQSGPQILSLGNRWADLTGTDTLNIAEFETWGTPTTYGLRLTGVGHVLNSTEIAPAGMSAQLDASIITCNGCFTGGSTASYVYGAGNKITGMSLGTVITDKGIGNQVTGNFSGSWYLGKPISQDQTFVPLKGRSDVAGASQPDFMDAGYPATPYKRADLWIWPKDFEVGFNSGSSPWSSYYQDDANSISGGEIYIHSGSNFNQFQQFGSNGFNLTIGNNFPASTGTFYFGALCPTGTTTLDVGVTSTDGYTVAAVQSCGPSLAIYSVPYNVTGRTGNVGIKNFLGTGVWVAWAYFKPNAANFNGYQPAVADGSFSANALSWAWSNGATTATDATSPLGFSTSLNGNSTLTSGGGFSSVVGGQAFPAVQSTVKVQVEAPAVITNTLNGAITNSATSITVNTPTTSTYAANGVLLIDQEIVTYSGTLTAGTTTFTVTRGTNGTTAQAHANGATVYSLGWGAIQAFCNSVQQAGTSIFWGPNWTDYSFEFPAQNCSGYPVSFLLAYNGGPTGQTWKIASLQVSPSPTDVTPTASGLVPISGPIPSNNQMFQWGQSSKPLAGSGTGMVTGPTSGTAAGHIVTEAGANGQVQDSGTALSSITPLTGTTASIGGSALAAGACTSGTVSIAGATTSMGVVATPVTYPGDGMAWLPYVSAAGTVTVKVCADAAGTPTASTYNVRVIP